jgi:hypothetical protein
MSSPGAESCSFARKDAQNKKQQRKEPETWSDSDEDRAAEFAAESEKTRNKKRELKRKQEGNAALDFQLDQMMTPRNRLNWHS